MMTFNVDINSESITLVRLNNKSCLLWIDDDGLALNDTCFPQPYVDYRKATHKIKITGVDIV